MAVVHINIGSNIGDRAALIERAVAALCARIDPEGRARITLAPIVESAPWGFESKNNFLNLGLKIETDGKVDADNLLNDILNVEREISAKSHRKADGSYADRPIDIDLIAVDDMIVDTARLHLPHPRMHLRKFVLAPLATLDSQWRHPIFNKTAAELLEDL